MVAINIQSERYR